MPPKASETLSASHRELCTAFVRLDRGALAAIRERPLSPATQASIAGETQMHHFDARLATGLLARCPGHSRCGIRSLGSLGSMEGANPVDPGDFPRRMVEEWLRDPEFRAKYERVYAEMLKALAPATEGPVLNPGRERRGRLIFGDVTE